MRTAPGGGLARRALAGDYQDSMPDALAHTTCDDR
jgi:hypothetical protein